MARTTDCFSALIRANLTLNTAPGSVTKLSLGVSVMPYEITDYFFADKGPQLAAMTFNAVIIVHQAQLLPGSS